MEKREQVFISSTFRDLVDERRAVLQTLLEADCIPAGMELFPASDTQKLDLIKGVIDLSDYYIVIVGGRYGSVDESEQLSYTEIEFDYAVAQKKPIMGFLHGEPGKIIADKTELDPELRRRLDAFREKVEKRPVKYWRSPEELAGQVALALIQMRKSHPAEGWVRGREAMTPDVRQELVELRARVAELSAQLSQERTIHATVDPETLATGDDEFTLDATVTYRPSTSPYEWEQETSRLQYEASWDRIFGYLAPSMMNEASEAVLLDRLSALCRQLAVEVEAEQPRGERWAAIITADVDRDSFNNVIVQFAGLGLIEVSDRKRGVNDTATYWRLTSKGTQHMMRLRTIGRQRADEATPPAAVEGPPSG